MKIISRKSAIRNIIFGLGTFPFLKINGRNKALIDIQSNWKGNINHSVCYWVYRETPLPEFCKFLLKNDVHTIDLIGPTEWPILKQLGMNLGMANGAELGLNEGWNHLQYHQELIKNYSELIPKLASYGYNNLICFSGQSKGISTEEGLENCFKGLKQIIPIAEKYKVTLTMELLNSKVDHLDYQCDHSVWGIELCKRLQSDNFKLLYDIYHMQIMEGDIIRNIKANYQYYSHYHTGGVPGRKEIDNTQELNYPAIMKAIAETGFKGSVAQEFIPSGKDKLGILLEAFKICDI